MGEDVDLNRLAAETCSFSGASLEALLNEAAILAAVRNAERIGQQDIDRAFYRTVAGEDAPRSVEPEEKLAIAAHEAGHAVALKALTPESRLKRVSISAASRGMAAIDWSIPKERTALTQKEMEAQIGVLLAGRAAEVLLGGEKALTSGAAGDLRSAAELMGSMVLDLGMGGEPAVASRAVAAACGGGNSQEQAICRQKLDEIYRKGHRPSDPADGSVDGRLLRRYWKRKIWSRRRSGSTDGRRSVKTRAVSTKEDRFRNRI